MSLTQYAGPDANFFEEVICVSMRCEEKNFAEGALGGNVRSIGAVYALPSIATQTGIYKSLKTVFGHLP